MNLESTLYFVTHHSESIIQWLFFAILLLAALIISRSIFGKPAEEVSTVTLADGSDMQKFLEKILNQTAKLETVALENLGPKAIGDVDAQVKALKNDLQAREMELNALKASGNSKVGADADKLTVRIHELEAKLAEYEILEDDIADLSLYKEENLRLRAELDKVKSPGSAAPAAMPPPAAASAGEDIVAEFAQAVNQEVTPPAKASADIPRTGDPMADFETAVNLEKKVQGEPAVAPAPAPAAAASVSAPATAVGAPAAEAAKGPAEGDDLFAEFANPPAESDGHSLDTDKMMAEMAALVSIEPAKGSALHEEIDTEKMAAEATRLTKS